jgi:hypothetical protein
MAKIILEFDPFEERDLMLCAVKSGSILTLIDDLDNELRQVVKYGNWTNGELATPEQQDTAEKIRDIIHKLAEDSDLSNLLFG